VRKRGWMLLVALVATGTITIAALATGAVGGTLVRQAKYSVALITDIGGLNDKSFNQASNKGRLLAEKKFKIKTRVYDTQSAADRQPNLLAASRDGYQLVFATGSLLFDAVDKVAPAFPKTKYAGIDIAQASSGNHPNVRGIIFAEQEAGYLVGYIAGLVVKAQKGPDVVSGIGANTVPAIVRYFGGYKAGVKKANPKATVLVNYAGDPTFNDQAKCKEVALNQIAQKTQIIFQIAGGCGIGALNAAKEAGLWGIGVDVNQSFFGKYILTSALKNLTKEVVATTAEFEQKGPAKFRTGFDKVYNLKNGGVGYAPLSTKVPKALRTSITKKVAIIAKQIAAGKIKPPKK
jgi:basic membrane protein A and related proteins